MRKSPVDKDDEPGIRPKKPEEPQKKQKRSKVKPTAKQRISQEIKLLTRQQALTEGYNIRD